MPSPFPGMNPYIERPEVWRDFHHRFLSTAAEMLLPLIRPRYFVKIEESVYLREPAAEDRRRVGVPDLTVHASSGVGPAVADPVAVASPAVLFAPAEVEEERFPYLEVWDRESRTVVTVIELLSPSNKDPGQDRSAYWNKVRRLLARTDAGLVELDLLRGGPRLPWPEMPACDYYALVRRRRDHPRIAFWPIRLRDPLPSVPVPLRAGEPEPQLDLQAVLHRVYDGAGYEMFIYSGRPVPPLAPDDAAWAAALVPPAH